MSRGGALRPALWVETQAGGDSPFFLRSSPVATSSTVSFLLRGEGPLTLRVGGPRVGFVEETLGIRITG
ncbi:MAG: hypothetical protein MUF34_21940 [Polyangiaceae bacterium]|nr:hypothetical protein [Polyangiaceae bacterium]